MKKTFVYACLLLNIHANMCSPLASVYTEEPNNTVAPQSLVAFYPQNDPHAQLITTVLYGTANELEQHLQSIESEDTKKELLNCGILATYTDSQDNDADNQNYEMRCTTVANELILRAKHSQNPLAKLGILLSHGYNPNARFQCLEPHTSNPLCSSLPLSNAIYMGHSQTVEQLLAFQANPQQPEHFGHTPLQMLSLCLGSSLLASQPGSTIPAPPATLEDYNAIAQIINEHNHAATDTDSD